jgi:hypothetical protein
MKKRSPDNPLNDMEKDSKLVKLSPPNFEHLTPLLYTIDKGNIHLVKTFLISCDPVNNYDLAHLMRSKHDNTILERIKNLFYAQIFADCLFMKNKLIIDGQKNFDQEAKELIISRVSANLSLMSQECQQKFATNLENTFNNNLIEYELFENIKKISTIATYFQVKDSDSFTINSTFQVEGNNIDILKDLFHPLLGDLDSTHHKH